tara:strand:+ start:2829 stop:3011 length:183 start_codon:yes stop_codon:yes gene_type:complete
MDYDQLDWQRHGHVAVRQWLGGRSLANARLLVVGFSSKTLASQPLSLFFHQGALAWHFFY